MSSVNIYSTFYRNIKFYSKSLKHTSFSTWFDSSRTQICCVKTIIVQRMAEVLPVAFLVSSTFFVILLQVKDKNTLETCAFYFVGPHKHNNISTVFCVGTLFSCCISQLCMKISHFNFVYAHFKMISLHFRIKVIHFFHSDEQPELNLENVYPNKTGHNLKTSSSISIL